MEYDKTIYQVDGYIPHKQIWFAWSAAEGNIGTDGDSGGPLLFKTQDKEFKQVGMFTESSLHNDGLGHFILFTETFTELDNTIKVFENASWRRRKGKRSDDNHSLEKRYKVQS